MTTRIAINGFGRIGRNILRAAIESARLDLKVVAINDLAPIETLVHLLKYDSIHGLYRGAIEITDKTIDLGTGPIVMSSNRKIEDLDWEALNVDIVLECTGLFTAREHAGKHLSAGAKRVLISAPGKPADKTIVYGVNHETLNKDDMIVSNGSCTTNALAPVVKVLHDSFDILSGFMTTVHAYTGDQPTLDTVHKDLNRGRAAALSMVPTSTGAAEAIALVIPELEGKLDGKAIRVPTPNVSVVDLNVVVSKSTNLESVNEAFIKAAQGSLKNILQTLNVPMVSIDLNHDPHSSSLALDQTTVVNGNQIRVLSWYDNEWGFSNRMLDTASFIGSFL